MALKIIHAETRGEQLFITVQGSNPEEVVSLEARRLAYNERNKHGFSNAGIEGYGGAFPVDMSKTMKMEDGTEIPGGEIARNEMAEVSARPYDLAYNHVFRLTRSI